MYNSENIEIKFGDEKIIEMLKRKKIKDIETTKITIDFKSLTKIGIERNQAINLLERLIESKKK